MTLDPHDMIIPVRIKSTVMDFTGISMAVIMPILVIVAIKMPIAPAINVIYCLLRPGISLLMKLVTISTSTAIIMILSSGGFIVLPPLLKTMRDISVLVFQNRHSPVVASANILWYDESR